MSETIVPIRKTRMGAVTLPHAIDPTISVELRWGRTHGIAIVTGYGRYLLVDISNNGIHRCKLLWRHKDGKEEVVEAVEPGRFCKLCERFRASRD